MYCTIDGHLRVPSSGVLSIGPQEGIQGHHMGLEALGGRAIGGVALDEMHLPTAPRTCLKGLLLFGVHWGALGSDVPSALRILDVKRGALAALVSSSFFIALLGPLQCLVCSRQLLATNANFICYRIGFLLGDACNGR